MYGKWYSLSTNPIKLLSDYMLVLYSNFFSWDAIEQQCKGKILSECPTTGFMVNTSSLYSIRWIQIDYKNILLCTYQIQVEYPLCEMVETRSISGFRVFLDFGIFAKTLQVWTSLIWNLKSKTFCVLSAPREGVGTGNKIGERTDPGSCWSVQDLPAFPLVNML